MCCCSDYAMTAAKSRDPLLDGDDTTQVSPADNLIITGDANFPAEVAAVLNHFSHEEPVLFGEPDELGIYDSTFELTSEPVCLDAMRISAPWMTALSTLKAVVTNNLEHFTRTTPAHARKTNRFHLCFSQISEHTDAITPAIELLNRNASKYDFDNVPANGFRSLLSVTDACLCHLVQTSRIIEKQREAFLFRKNSHLKNLEEYTKILGALRKMLNYASHMTGDKTGSVFPKEGSKLIEEWFKEVETLNQEVFYGRSLGFQFAPSVHTMLQTIVLAMAVCAETYRSWEKWKPGSANIAKTVPNMFMTTRFIMRPELRAKQIVHTTRNADINFCKQFWGLTEASYLQSGFNWILPSVAINEVIELPPELLEIPGISGKNVFVKPSSPSKPVYTRYISDVQTATGGDELPELSPSLIFHCHGGGFIAQSSKAHESYLLKWAKDLKVPIFSVDYALAPEDPYPRGLDEVVYAYAWALKNRKRLGWTGEKVCFVGDSAGANLVVSAALKIFCKGLPPPTGILAAYGAFLVQYTPSPSRLLCLMDPILPMGILTRCLAAYAGIQEPTSVGQVQGADDKVSHENQGERRTGDGSHQTPRHPSQRPGNLSNESSSMVDMDQDAAYSPVAVNGDSAGGDVVDGPQPDTPPGPYSSHWFGRTVSSLFKNIQAKPVEVANEVSVVEDPEKRMSPKESRELRGTDKVEPLPRYNFASVSVEDPFLSPLLAEDHILTGLPPIYLVACHLDPLLDDSISFARRLRQLNKAVHLDVMNHLPHGFLNFSLLSAEAAAATVLCAKRIQKILGLDDSEAASQR